MSTFDSLDFANYPPFENYNNDSYYNNPSVSSRHIVDTERLRYYLRSLFEQVETHVISEHIPLLATSKVLGLDVRQGRHFSGIQVCYHPNRFGTVVACGCGMHWQISDTEFRSSGSLHAASEVVDNFCDMINSRYGARDDREASYRVFNPPLMGEFPSQNITLTKEAQEKADKSKAEEEKRKAEEAAKKIEEEKRRALAAEEFKEILASVSDEVKEQLGKLF